MEAWLVVLLTFVGSGVIGALSRIGFMRLGHDEWCKWDEAAIFVFFGAVGGAVAHQLGESYLTAGATGFMMSDIISQLAQAWAARANGD